MPESVLIDSEWVDVGTLVVDDAGGGMTAAEILTELKTVDGAGSGLDADLLDGQSSAYYATATSVTNAISTAAADATSKADAAKARATHTGTQTASTISDLTETVQDMVGAMATDSATVNFTYDDSAGTFTAVVQGLASSDVSDFAEAVRDRVGATLVAGTGIDIAVSDPGDTITIACTVIPSDIAYDATAWNGVTTVAPSKNAVRDAIEGLSGTYETPAGAQAKADAKVADAINDATTTVAPSQNAVFDALALKAPLASPALTGNPTAPTATQGDSDTSIATTAFVNAEILADAYTPGGTDVAVVDGGTGASTAGAARTNLGLGTAAQVDTGTAAANVPTITQADARYQASDSDLTEIAALADPSDFKNLANNAGTWGFFAPTAIVAESHADVTVSNTTTEGDIVSLVLPAGAVAAGDLVRMVVIGDLLNNTGSSRSFQFKFKIGATTVLDTSTTVAVGASASRRFTVITITAMIASTTAQRVGGQLEVATPVANNWSPSTSNFTAAGYGTAAENLASASTWALTMTHSFASTSQDFVAHAASLEVIKKR